MIEAEYFVEVDSLNAALRYLAGRVGKSFPDLLRTAARTLARTLAEFTQPYGTWASARKKGQATAGFDLSRVYVTPASMYERIKHARLNQGSRGTPEGVAKAFIKATHQGNVSRAQRILESSGLDGRLRLNLAKVGEFDGGAEHKRRRSGSTGRVQGKVPTVILMNAKPFKKYEKKVLTQDVGTAKGAWADCLVKLGVGERGVPKWLARAGAGMGKVEEKFSWGEPYIALTALPPYMSRVITDNAEVMAAHVAAGKMHKMVDKMLEYEARKALEG